MLRKRQFPVALFIARRGRFAVLAVVFDEILQIIADRRKRHSEFPLAAIVGEARHPGIAEGRTTRQQAGGVEERAWEGRDVQLRARDFGSETEKVAQRER